MNIIHVYACLDVIFTALWKYKYYLLRGRIHLRGVVSVMEEDCK